MLPSRQSQFIAFQIPHYIRTLTELLAHTPHDHVDRKQLEFAKRKLEELSHVSSAPLTSPRDERERWRRIRLFLRQPYCLLSARNGFGEWCLLFYETFHAR